MAKWNEHIELNAAINRACDEFDLTCHEEDCPTEVKEMLATELAKSQRLGHFANQMRSVKSIAAMNRLLVRVYDEADRFKIWLGL